MRVTSIASVLGLNLSLFGFEAAVVERADLEGTKSVGEWASGQVRFRLLWEARAKQLTLELRTGDQKEWVEVETATKQLFGSYAAFSKLEESLYPVLREHCPDSPAFPLVVRYSDGETQTITSISHAAGNLEWFDTNDTQEPAEVRDDLGRPVELVVDTCLIKTLLLG